MATILAGSIDLGTAAVVVLALLALGALIVRSLAGGDEERIALDLRRRGAQLVRCTRTHAGGEDERSYEVVYALADGVERHAVCKASLTQGVWWQGDLPPAEPPTQPAAPPTPEPEAVEVADIDPAVALEGLWRAEEDPDREHDDGEDNPALRPIEDLIEVLRGGEARACERAVDELVKHGEAAVAALTQALEDPDPDVRVDARKALQRIQAG